MRGTVIGRGTWIDKVAHELVERERRLGRSLDLITTESGLGASGIPHIGSMADAVRSYAVSLALGDAGYPSKTIAFSDDMDGLRRVPAGLPEGLEEHLLKPVSMIPDPFGCHSSYGEHMSGLLRDALDRCGVEYEHRSGREMYRSGVLAPYIEKILLNWRVIGEKIEEMTGQEKFKEALPYFPICKGCGRIYTTKATRYDAEAKKVYYTCGGAEIRGRWFEGCGYEGEADIRRDDGKLNWKAEFAARWACQDIRFEAYGKDIADSVRVNDWVSKEILGFEPPLHVRYEMFLDRLGGKISKSAGNIFTPQMWLQYASPESLLLYLLKRFQGTRRLSLETPYKMMVEMDHLKDIYHGRVEVKNRARLIKVKGLLEYAHRLQPVKDVGIPYTLLVELAYMAPPKKEKGFILSRLKAYGYGERIDEEVEKKIDYAINWTQTSKRRVRKRRLTLTEAQRRALAELVEEIGKASTSEEIQGATFTVMRRNQLKAKEFFPILYMALLGRREGPRIGSLIMDMGKEYAAKTLSKYI